MRTYLKVEGLWTIVANSYEEPEDNGELSEAEMKNLEAKYRQDAKALSKIQMGFSTVYFEKIVTCSYWSGGLLQQWDSCCSETVVEVGVSPWRNWRVTTGTVTATLWPL
ncbi:hypothetical protein HAX54_026169 [Datura stramonium]|uniref:Uncharacterized protein n=1 Tax=Datura stramonium TaxID=4076 RepID=A0ABS8S7M6_DATST|nr:hypothetical protein [Datura stramonium]